jgi:putative heme-binding domain-containing protein
LAADLEKEGSHSERSIVVSQFEPAAKLVGNPDQGKEWFSQRCSTCHMLEGIGKPVGPDLLELTDKSPESLMISIIDPNRAVLDQYTVYEIEIQDGRSLSGAISEESKAGISYKKANGDLETIAQDVIQSIRATGLSLMPEGLEAGMKHQDMADLTAFIAQAKSSKEPPPRDPGVIAKYLLNDEIPNKEREAATKVHYMLAVELVREMVRDLPVGTPEEYRRIPWIWRLSVLTGNGNDTDRIRRMLDLALPQPNQPLHDWQAVIIGGGLINGLSQKDIWPKQHLDKLTEGDPDLENRYKHALILAVNMADNEMVPSGTRYDALRMVAMLEPSNAIPHLQRHLNTETEQELQMGAISGLADIRHPEALNVLNTSTPNLSEPNRTLANKGIEKLKQLFDMK